MVTFFLCVCVLVICIFGFYCYVFKNQSQVIPSEQPLFKGEMFLNEEKEYVDNVNSKPALVIVDFQKDFYDKEHGSLYVNGAENCVENICNEIRSGKYKRVICTMDWHPSDDPSFKEFGGEWPPHCVNFTEGAMLHPDIYKAIIESGVEIEFFWKGDNYEEEYGAFEICNPEDVSSYDPCVFETSNLSETVGVSFSEKSQYAICGLAGDYCVWETYKNLRRRGLEVEPLYDCMAFIGEQFDYVERFDEQMTSKNI